MEIHKSDEFKAFQGFVNKVLFDFHENHPNDSISRKEIEEECFGRWPDLDVSAKRNFLNINTEHFDVIKSVDMPMPSKKSKDTKNATKSMLTDCDESTKRKSESEEKPPIKKRKTKDLNAPRKYISAYSYFREVALRRVVEENPEMKGKVPAEVIRKQWKDALPDVRNKYIEMAKLDKQRYYRELAEYTMNRGHTSELAPVSSDAPEENYPNTPNSLTDRSGCRKNDGQPGPSIIETLEDDSDEELFDGSDGGEETTTNYTALGQALNFAMGNRF